jgi:hypothetical protein
MFFATFVGAQRVAKLKIFWIKTKALIELRFFDVDF